VVLLLVGCRDGSATGPRWTTPCGVEFWGSPYHSTWTLEEHTALEQRLTARLNKSNRLLTPDTFDWLPDSAADACAAMSGWRVYTHGERTWGMVSKVGESNIMSRSITLGTGTAAKYDATDTPPGPDVELRAHMRQSAYAHEAVHLLQGFNPGHINWRSHGIDAAVDDIIHQGDRRVLAAP